MGGSILSSLERRKGHYMKVFQLKAEEKRKIYEYESNTI